MRLAELSGLTQVLAGHWSQEEKIHSFGDVRKNPRGWCVAHLLSQRVRAPWRPSASKDLTSRQEGQILRTKPGEFSGVPTPAFSP
jgi:hypothetical protein